MNMGEFEKWATSTDCKSLFAGMDWDHPEVLAAREAWEAAQARAKQQQGELLVALGGLQAWFESQRKAISKGCGSSWDMNQCDEQLAVIDTAFVKTKAAQAGEGGVNLPRVTCDICQKPVDRLAAWHDDITREIVLKAYCHGDTDIMKIDQLKLTPELARQLEGAEGVAFTAKRINSAAADREEA